MDLPMHMAALDFARRAGVDPDLSRWVDLARPLLFGPLVPAVFRLEGPDALPHAASEVKESAGRLSGIRDNRLEPEEAAQLAAIGDAAGFGPQLAQLVIEAEDRSRLQHGVPALVCLFALGLLALVNLTGLPETGATEGARVAASQAAVIPPVQSLHARDDRRSA